MNQLLLLLTECRARFLKSVIFELFYERIPNKEYSFNIMFLTTFKRHFIGIFRFSSYGKSTDLDKFFQTALLVLLNFVQSGRNKHEAAEKQPMRKLKAAIF